MLSKNPILKEKLKEKLSNPNLIPEEKLKELKEKLEKNKKLSISDIKSIL
jgi:hypothetical protein